MARARRRSPYQRAAWLALLAAGTLWLAPSLASAQTPDAPTIAGSPPASPTSSVVTFSVVVAPPGNNLQYLWQWREGSYGAWNARTPGSGSESIALAVVNNRGGALYQARARASANGVAGPWSNIANVRLPGSSFTPPSAPANLVATSPTTGQLRLRWDAPAGAVGDYDVAWRLQGSTDWIDWDASDADDSTADSQREIVLTNLRNGATYEMRVRAANLAGDGPWSASVQAAALAAAPAPPTQLVLRTDDGEIAASWRASDNDGGAAITHYRVSWRPATSTGAPTTQRVNADTTRFTIGQLDNGVSMQVQVFAVNAIGDSAPLTGTAAAAAPPAAPQILPNLFQSSSIVIEVQSPAPRGSVQYIWQWRVGGYGPWQERVQTDPEFRTSPGQNGARIFARARARRGPNAAPSAWSNIVSRRVTTPFTEPIVAPAAPGNLVVQAASRSSLRLRWDAPAGPVGDYDVEYKHNADSVWLPLDADDTEDIVPDTARSAILDGLIPEQAYDVRVRAANLAGNGPWSAEARAAPMRVPPDAPVVRIIATRKTQILLGWSVPANGGAAITSYELQYKLSGADDSTWRSDNVFITANAARIDELVNGVAYEIRVRAVNAIGAGPWSNTQPGIAAVPPEAPQTLALSPENAQLSATWSAPSDNGGQAVSGYEIAWKRSDDSVWQEVSQENTNTSFTIDQLVNGVAYEVRVRAINPQGKSMWSDIAEATPRTVPSAPDQPSAVAGATSIALTWTALGAADTGGSPVLRYEVAHKLASADDTEYSSAGVEVSGTSATVTGLTKNMTYVARVRAVNQAGASPWSRLSNAVLVVGVPDAPLEPLLTASDQQIAVRWQKPGNDGGRAIAGYTLQYRTGGELFADNSVAIVGGDTLAHTLTSLTNGAAYDVRVLATNNVGMSAPSAAASATPHTVPSAPAAPSASGGTGQMTLSWTAPASNGGAAIASYGVEWKLMSADDADYSSAGVELSGLSATVTGLTKNMRYVARVRALNQAGASAWSEASSAALVVGVPDAPPAPSLIAGDQQIAASWQKPGNDGGREITGYVLQYRTGSEPFSDNSMFLGGGGTLAHSIASLINGAAYDVRVLALNSIGMSAPSAAASATPHTVPAAPAAPDITGAHASLVVSWQAPAANGRAIVGYDVEYRVAPNGEWKDAAHSGTATSITIGELMNGQAYDVQLRATNAAGASAWSPAARGSPVADPTAPIWSGAVQLTPGDRMLDVQWSAPNDGGRALTALTLKWTPQGGSESTRALAADATSAKLSLLTNGVAVRVVLVATNAIGSTESDPVSATPLIRPAQPVLELADTATSGQLALSWSEPANGGSPITDYDVRWREGTSGDWNLLNPDETSTARTATIASLVNGRSYEVQVRAANRLGEGAFSASLLAAPQGAPRAPPSNFFLQSAVGRIRIHVQINPGHAERWGGREPIRYELEYRPVGASAWLTDERIALAASGIAPVESSVTSGPAIGIAHEFRARTINAEGASGVGPWTASAFPSATLQGAPQDPPAALNLNPAATMLTLSWQAPQNTGGLALGGYDVEYRLSGASEWSSATHSGTQASAEVASLAKGQAWEMRVRAKNEAGSGPWSAIAQAATLTTVPSAPLPPALRPLDEALDVRWSAPDDAGGLALSGYIVEYRQHGASLWRNANHMGRETAHRIADLTNDQLYEVRVFALNSVGQSAVSEAAEATPSSAISIGPPAQPHAPTLQPGAQLGSLEVSWSAPLTHASLPITAYQLRHRVDGSSADWAQNAHSSSATSALLTGLQEAARYEVQLRARNGFRENNADGWSSWSPPVRAIAAGPRPPAPPTQVQLVPGDQRLIVRWRPPAPHALVPVIIGYRVEHRVGAEGDWADAGSARGNVAQSVILRLSDSSSYQVRVFARNRIGESPPSAAASGATISPRPPAQPTRPELYAMASNSLMAKWRVPQDGGTPITAWQLRWKLAHQPERFYRTQTAAPQTTSTMLTELEEGAEYHVQVRAQNRVGMSPWSPVAQAEASFTQRSARAASAALARAGNVLAAGAVDVLGSRLAGGSRARRSRLTLAGLTLTPLPPGHAPAERTRIHTHADEPAPRRVMDLAELLGRSNFELRLTRANRSQPNGQARRTGRTDGRRTEPDSDTGITLWGRGTLRGFQNETDSQMELNGNAYSGWFGMDYAWRRATLGLAGAFNQTRTAFRSADAPNGNVTAQLGSFYPYLAIAPHERVRIWALAGFGWGMLEFEEQDAAGVQTDLTMQVYAGGISTDILRSRGFRLAVKSDVSQASFRTQAQPDLPAVQAEPGRFRLALESQLNANWNTASLSPTLEAAMRVDYGDAASGGRTADLGMEIGGGLMYQHRKLGLTLDARGRWLVLHQDSSAQEWGASFLMRVAPDTLGRGMQASLTPSWGRTQSERERLWRDDSNLGTAQPQETGWQPDRLSAELGYGVALWNERALITPFATWSMGESGGQTYGGGTRLKLGSLKLELTGEQQTSPTAPTDHRFSLHLSMPLGK